MAVRRESVVLDLDDRLTPGLIRAAAAAGVLDRELNKLDGQSVRTSRSLSGAESDAKKFGNTAGGSSREIDRFSGRLKLLGTAAVALGPALTGIGAAGVPVVTGLATQFGAVALGAGTAVLAFHGVGGALTALNKAALDPTVTNLNAAQLALDALPPAAAAFARELAKMRPQLEAAQQAAASGLFPGLTAGLEDLQSALPQVDRILNKMGQTLGNLGAEGAHALSGPAWEDFRNFIEREAPAALATFGHSLGNVIHGLAGLVMATSPLSHGFADGMLEASKAFDQWANSVSKTQGFQDFLAFVEKSGPEVADALGAMGSALLAIVRAAAPLSGPVLHALTAVANAIAAIGDSDIGTPIYATVAALAVLGRAQSAFGRISATSWATAFRGAEGYSAKVNTLRGPLIRGGLAAAGLGLAASGVADKFGLANTATLALTGSLAGPWGAAAGAAVGLALDFAGGQHEAVVNTADLTSTLNQQTGAITQNTRAYVAQQLQQKGVLDAAQQIGVNLRDVTSASLGNSDAQARVNAQMDAYSASIAGSAPKQGEFADNATKVKDAVEGTSGALRHVVGATAQTNAAIGKTSGKFGSAASAAEKFRQELDRVNDTLTGRSAMRDYQAALDDLTASIKKNGRSLDITTAKGRENQAALDNIAKSALAVAQGMKGTNQTHFLAQARKDFVDSAQKLGIARGAAQDLATKLGLVNRIHAKPTVDLNTNAAVAELNAVQAAISGIDRVVNVSVNVTRHTNALLADVSRADGGEIPGPRHPYGDKVLAMVAPGEEIITNRNGEADQFRRDRASGLIPHYAGGGTVGGGSGNDHARSLERALNQLQKSVDADRKSRDSLAQAARQQAQTTRDTFRSDFLGVDAGAWGMASDPASILRGDIRGARRFRHDIRDLRGRGLDSALAGQVTSLAQADQLDAMSNRGLRELQHLFAVRQRVSSRAGESVSAAAYGHKLDIANHLLHQEVAESRHLRQELAHLRKEQAKNADRAGKATAGAMNNAAATSARKVRPR